MKSNETNITAYEIMFKDYPDVVGVKELSSMLGMCDKKIYQLIKHGNIPTIPCGRIIKVAKINVIRYVLESDVTFNQKQIKKNGGENR